VLGVEEDHHEDFVGFVSEEELKVVTNSHWAVEVAGLTDLTCEQCQGLCDQGGRE
jgi:hypothetical protein